MRIDQRGRGVARACQSKRGGNIKQLTLTPFWHRRVCEATLIINAIIIALFIFSSMGGIGNYEIGMFAVGISVVSMIIATLSYLVIPEKSFSLRVLTALSAYALLLGSVGYMTVSTGTYDSPFLALWMITSIFAGTFGLWIVGVLLAGLSGYTVWLWYEGLLVEELIIGITLAGFLPVIVSHILWHSKSNSEKTNERAYYDLASELNQVSGKSDTVIGAISDGVIAINNQGNIELINPAAIRMTGWGKQDALGLDYKSVLQLLSKDGSALDKSKDPVFEVLTTNQAVRREDLVLQTNAGKKLNIELVVSPIGRIGEGGIIVFRDITKEQQDEKEQAEFISTASHEMRTPVASIEGYLGLALNPATAKIDDKAREYISKAHESAQHLGHLFQDLLDVTKADDGRLKNNPKVIDLVSFTDGIVGGLKPKAEAKGLTLFFKPVGDEVGGLKNLEPVYYVDVDADHLREILNNLVENAIKYTKQGEVVVDLHGDDDHAVVAIKDSGIGIPTEDIPHLFQKFYRVDNSDTREIGGTGLGLYLCRRLVEAMEGRIWVESEFQKGSTFFVELPRISHMEAQRRIEAASAEVAKPEDNNKYIDKTKVDAETQKHRQIALNTPIIVAKGKEKGGKSGSQSMPYKTPVAKAPAPNPADQLLGGNSSNKPEPIRNKDRMVIPTSAPANPPNNQQASTPPTAPKQTPAPTPVPPPRPAPTVPPPRVPQPPGNPVPVDIKPPAPVSQPTPPSPQPPTPTATPISPPAPVTTQTQTLPPAPKATQPVAEQSTDDSTPILEPEPTAVPKQAPPITAAPAGQPNSMPMMGPQNADQQPTQNNQ